MSPKHKQVPEGGSPEMLPERIREPESIELPDDASEVMSHLTPEGRKDFIDEIMHALASVKPRGDFRPVLDVVDAWYRTMHFVVTTSPEEEAELQHNIDEILELVKNGDHGQTFEELREELDLPAPTRRVG